VRERTAFQQALGSLYGSAHYTQITGFETLFAKFNDGTTYKLYIDVDETGTKIRPNQVQSIKSLITEDTQQIRHKFANSYVKAQMRIRNQVKI